MTMLWCSSKFAQLYKFSVCNKININPSLWNIDNIAPLVVNIYLGLRPPGNIPTFGAIFIDIPRGRVEYL